MTSRAAMRDAVMLGLRLTAGTSIPELEARHGRDPELHEELAALLREGLLVEHLPVANFVFARLVEAPEPRESEPEPKARERIVWRAGAGRPVVRENVILVLAAAPRFAAVPTVP